MKTMQHTGVVALIVTLAFPFSVASVSAQSSADDPSIEELQQQLENLHKQIEQLRDAQEEGNDENATSTDAREDEEEDEEESATSTNGHESGDLPQQANDRARQVHQCLELGRTLRSGDAGDTVKNLQKYLKTQGYFDYEETTGYYGSITREAVQAFQAEQGIVSNGSPETTGYGQVGPKTRAALAQSTCLRQTAPGQQVRGQDGENDTAPSSSEWEDDARGNRPEHAGPPENRGGDDDEEKTGEEEENGDDAATST